MLKRCLLLSLVAISGLSLAQTPAAPVTWGDPGQPFRIVYLNGDPIARFQNGKVWIDVFQPREADKRLFTATVLVGNPGKQDLDVNPSTFSAHVNDDKHPVLLWADGDQILAKQEKSADRRSRIAAGLAGFAAGAQTQTATVNNSDGSVSTVQYHDPTATAQAEADADARNESTVNRFARLSSLVLRRNTVSPGSDVIGRVYFRGEAGLKKKAVITEIDIAIDGTTFASSGMERIQCLLIHSSDSDA